MTEIVNLSISQSAASELSRQASFGGSPGEMSIDLVEDKNCSEGWMHIKLRPGTCNGSPISRTEGVTLYADVKKFNLLKDLKLDYYGDLSGGGFLISTPKKCKTLFLWFWFQTFVEWMCLFLQTNIIFINWLLSR